MPRSRFPLDKLPQLLKNPPPDKDIMLYDKKKERASHPRDNIMNKPTLSQRMDRLEGSITKLTEEMRDGFKQVNTRIDRIEARLDYNNLKELPNNK